MSTLYILLLSFLALLAVLIGGLVAYYYLDYLTLPQLMLVYIENGIEFDEADASSIVSHYSGKWASMSDLQSYVGQGFFAKYAGFLSDTTTLEPLCPSKAGNGAPPLAYYTSDSGTLGNACSRGYYIIGNRRLPPPDGYSVLPFNSGSIDIENFYTIKSWKDFTTFLKVVYSRILPSSN